MNGLKGNLNPIIILYYLGVLTVSFDILLVWEIGFNIRATQIFQLLPIFVGFSLIFIGKRVRTPLGFSSLLLWTLFILLFIPNTTFLPRSLGYGFWLVFNLFLIFATVNIFRSTSSVLALIKWYLFTFYFVAVFGLIQFTLPLLHLGAPLITQWWIPGVLARINGFSYEPSYFSTYLLMGWVLSIYLIRHRSKLIRRNYLWISFATITLAMVFSGSRMGWFMMILWSMQYPVLFLKRFMLGKINRVYLRYTLVLVLIATFLGGGIFYGVGFDNVRFLWRGMGLADSPAHSVASRLSTFSDTLQLFLNSPLIGYSLGGISSALGELRGSPVTSLALAKQNEGMCVFAEVLAASGIVGFIPFLIYIAQIIIKPLKLARIGISPEIKILLRAMAFSLLYELFILQFNQNILRPYLWLHISILSAIYAVAIKEKWVVSASH